MCFGIPTKVFFIPWRSQRDPLLSLRRSAVRLWDCSGRAALCLAMSWESGVARAGYSIPAAGTVTGTPALRRPEQTLLWGRRIQVMWISRGRFLPVAVSCVANCPAVECSCPAVECVCSCDTPEPKALDANGEPGWRELFVQPVVFFSWLGIGMLSGLCGRCSVQRSGTSGAAPPSPLLQLGHHAGDVSSPDRRRAEALRALPRRGRLA